MAPAVRIHNLLRRLFCGGVFAVLVLWQELFVWKGRIDPVFAGIDLQQVLVQLLLLVQLQLV
jgi:hypothetical protein